MNMNKSKQTQKEKKSTTHSHFEIMRYSWIKIGYFKHLSFSRSKANFSKFFFVIDNRFNCKISEPIENNLSTAAELRIALLNLLNFCNHASLL